MISARTVKDVVAGLSKSIADDPAYADELVAIDMWDRRRFSQYAGYEFTNAAWQDFVDFCTHEPIDWTDWFETWRKEWVGPSSMAPRPFRGDASREPSEKE